MHLIWGIHYNYLIFVAVMALPLTSIKQFIGLNNHIILEFVIFRSLSGLSFDRLSD